MGTTAEKLDLLKATKANLKAALIEQGQTPGDVMEAYPDMVRAIKTGIDTSDATAKASDMADGVTAYVNGKKVTGNVSELKAGAGEELHYYDVLASDVSVISRGKHGIDRLCRRDSSGSVAVPFSAFGDATAADVASGKTFTSAAGLKVTGTASGGGGYHTVNLTNSNLVTIDTAGNLVIQPPTDIDIATISGVENFGVRIYKSSSANKEYREMLIISFSTEYYAARFLHTFWSGTVSPQSASATLEEIVQSFCEVDFNETTKVLTLTPNDEVSLLDYGDPNIYIRVTYALH